MSESITLDDLDLDINHLTTEDDQPVDNLPSEKQQRLLTEPLYSSGFKPKDTDVFLAAANVGVFYSTHRPPLVPDVFLSLGVEIAENWWEKKNRSYFTWEFGKPPDVAIEIVSNREGNELGSKLRDYAQIGVKYYIVFDPSGQLSQTPLQIYQIKGMAYVEMKTTWLEHVGLGVTLWEGTFEGKHDLWLRWCDQSGQVLLTGAENARQENQRAEQEYQRAEQEYQRAEQEHQRAEQERQRAEQESHRAEQESHRAEQEAQRADRLAAKLKALGMDPDRLSDE
jgi:Uma2 family endonuclease